MSSTAQFSYPGGFQPNDGTIDFYLRVRSVLPENGVVVDLGAGRAGWFEDETSTIRREIRTLRPAAGKIIAIDVDPAVLDNRAADETLHASSHELPLDDESVDVIVCDFVLEHVEDPAGFVAELSRVLKPGGWFCARTPHKFHYVSIGARLFANHSHRRVLKVLQPDRKPEDVFPTVYRMNTRHLLQDAFQGWTNRSFLFRSNPSYFAGNAALYGVLDFAHRVAPLPLVGNLMGFFQKPPTASAAQPTNA